MAGDDSGDAHKFTGIQKYFNSYTTRGRANVVCATYASLLLGVLYFKFKPSKNKTEGEK